MGPDDYAWTYTYDNGLMVTESIDLGIDTSNEAQIIYEWESGTCLSNYSWGPRAEPNFVAGEHPLFVTGTGYVKSSSCGE